MTDRELRCRQCGAAGRPGAPWCTQCYTSLQEQSQPTPRAAPTPHEPTALATSIAVETPTAHWPCTACGAPNDFACDVCTDCGVPFLAAARESEPLLVLPVVGDLTAMSKARRTWLAVAVVAAFVVVCALLGLLLA